MFAMDFIDDDGLGDFGKAAPVQMVLHSHGISAGTNHIPHAIESVSGSGQSIAIRGWANRFGTMTLTLSGVDVARLVARYIPMGMPCKFKVGFEGMSYSDWECVGIYRFDGLSGSRNQWKMKFGDLGKLLQSAQVSTARGVIDLSATVTFEEHKTRTNASTGDWDPTTDTYVDLEVGGISGIKKDGESGTRGLIYCTAKGHDAEPFYAKYTSVTATLNRINLVNSDVMGTSRPYHPISGGEQYDIEHVNYIHDDLPRIIEKFILDDSDGLGTMPDGLNMGFTSSGLFNAPDFDMWTTRWERFQAFKADMFSLKRLANPYRFLSGFLADAGAWLVMKEGRLSWRFAHDVSPLASGVYGYDTEDFRDYTITDQDIISVDRYDLFNNDAREQVVLLQFLDSYTTDAVKANPATVDRADSPRANNLAFNDDVLPNNRDNAASNLSQRLRSWYTSIPDTLTLNLRGWRWLHMVPGDVAVVQSDYIPDLITPGADKLDGEPFMITSVHVNWKDFSCTVEMSRPNLYSAFTVPSTSS